MVLTEENPGDNSFMYIIFFGWGGGFSNMGPKEMVVQEVKKMQCKVQRAAKTSGVAK